MSEQAFKAALDPVSIVRSRATTGGPQPKEMQRMLALAEQKIQAQMAWEKEQRARIDGSLARLDQAFLKLQSQ